jgi:hypothetical protein
MRVFLSSGKRKRVRSVFSGPSFSCGPGGETARERVVGVRVGLCARARVGDGASSKGGAGEAQLLASNPRQPASEAPAKSTPALIASERSSPMRGTRVVGLARRYELTGFSFCPVSVPEPLSASDGGTPRSVRPSETAPAGSADPTAVASRFGRAAIWSSGRCAGFLPGSPAGSPASAAGLPSRVSGNPSPVCCRSAGCAMPSKRSKNSSEAPVAGDPVRGDLPFLVASSLHRRPPRLALDPGQRKQHTRL